MQILKHDEERLHPALGEQEPLCPIKRTLPALLRIERIPGAILVGNVEQRKERRQKRLKPAACR
jgi:hypothetical protein